MILVPVPHSLKCPLFKPQVLGVWHGSLEKDFFNVYYLGKNYSLGFCRFIYFSLDRSFGIINNQVVLFSFCIVFRGLSYRDRTQYFIPWFMNLPLCSLDHVPHFSTPWTRNWGPWLGGYHSDPCNCTAPTAPALKLRPRSQKMCHGCCFQQILHWPSAFLTRFESMSQKFIF